MRKILVFCLIGVVWTISAFAQNPFQTIGQIDSFDYNPKENAYDLEHAIIYYLPKTYSPENKYKVLVIWHGGGASTDTYSSSKDAAHSYLRGFIKYAENQNVILLAPASSVGWSYVARVLTTELLMMAKKNLNIDTNRVLLWGHSMGGMGITREAHWINSQFAGLMPNAAGMQDKFMQHLHYLKTYFNTPFVHINGLNDHFKMFKTQAEKTFKQVTQLESVLKIPAKYKLIFHPGGHNYDKETVFSELNILYAQPRNLYQSPIFPLFNRMRVVDSKYGPNTSYELEQSFWLSVKFKASNLPGVTYGQADIFNNTVTIKMDTSNLDQMTVLLSEKMLDFALPIKIDLNGKTIFNDRLKQDAFFQELLKTERLDNNFVFENKVTIDL